MRVLQLVTTRQRRGAEVFATQLSDSLAARGHDVMVLGLLPPPADPLTPALAGADDLELLPRGRFELARLRKLLRAIANFRPDVVQANGSQTLKYGAFAKRFSSPFPLVYRNISVASQWVRGPAHRLWGRWLARALDHVSSVSEESSMDFGVTYGVAQGRRSVIRRGILIPREVDARTARERLARHAGVSPASPLLVHVGSYSEEKNHGWLVDTFKEIVANRPDARLVLIGEGALRPSVEARIAELGLQGSVRPLGLRPDAAELVAGADLFVLPSRIEGIPGALLEAAAQAVPAVATRVGGMAEAIDHGRTGLMVALGDREAFVAAVEGLLADDERRRAMGIAARESVRERFSMDATTGAFEQLYTRLIRENQKH